MEDQSGVKVLKAIVLEDKPISKKGDKKTMPVNGKSKKVIIRNVYSRRLEDLTFSDLEMIGYRNPNIFVKEWSQEHNSFDKDKIVWVVVYAEEEQGEKKE